jgi:DNA-binding transcriptional ArsR family regulator
LVKDAEPITEADRTDAVGGEKNLSDEKSRGTNTADGDRIGERDTGAGDSDTRINHVIRESDATGDAVDAGNGRTGLTLTRQEPAAPIATLALDGRTVTDLWTDLLDTDAGRNALVDAVRSFAGGRTVPELYDALEERDVPYRIRFWIRDIARGTWVTRRGLEQPASLWFVERVAPMLGSSRSAVEDLLATARLFDALDGAGTIAVRVGEAFRDQRRDQREAVCSLLEALAGGFDVRLVGSGVTLAWLAREHRSDLPGVSEWCNTPRDRTPVADAVDEALATLDPDGRAVSILRTIADEPGETATYHALYTAAMVGESAVRQHIGTLADLDLVDTFGPDSDKKVELLEAGREYLDESTQQTALFDGVSETPQYHLQAVLPQASTGGGEGESRPYRTAYMNRPTHAAAVGCGGSDGVTLVEHLEDGPEMNRVRLVSYDEDREEAVVGVRATRAFQYVVSLATALASPRFLDAIPLSRVESLDEPPAIPRDARCIGALSDDALEDAGTLRDAFVEWGEEIADMTRADHHGEYEDRDRFRGEIMRSAHGLAGSIVHLLDAVGVDLVREVRVPGGLSFDHLEELAESVGISTAIQSQYGVFATYRQLFESREEKRRTALSPEVDASDPVGELIGSFVFRGPDVTRLRESLEDHLSTPSDLVDDAPEFVVPVAIREAGRSEYAATLSRALEHKRLRATRPAVSIMQALAGSPYDAAAAIHQLEPESFRREVRPEELRYALATLDESRILSDLPPTVGKIISTLLRTDERLSQAALADRADVSGESIRRHRDRLEALGLVARDAAGTYRLALSFQTREERRDPVTPDTVDEDFTEAVATLLEAALPPDRYGDPSDPVAGALFWPPDPWGTTDEPGGLTPWIETAGALTGVDPPDRTATVSIGPTPEQTPLTSNGSGDLQISGT